MSTPVRSLVLHAVGVLGILAIVAFTVLNTSHTLEIRHLARTLNQETQVSSLESVIEDSNGKKYTIRTVQKENESIKTMTDRHLQEVAEAKERLP